MKKKSVYARCMELTETEVGGHLLIEGKCIFHISAFFMHKGFVQAGTDFTIEVDAEHLMTLSNENDVFVRLIQVNDPEPLLSIEVMHFRDAKTKEVLSMDRLYELQAKRGNLHHIKDHG